MDAAQKSFELQAQVRQNAEVVKDTLSDLYKWEKEIKVKERKVQSQPENNADKNNLNTPIRTSRLSPSCEKQDAQNDLSELKLKHANEMKDIGNKHVKLAEYAKAIEAYTGAIQLYANNAVYYSNRALCYLKLGRYHECIKDCEAAIAIDDLAVKAYYRRMLANEYLCNNQEAIHDCLTVLMLEPKNSEGKCSLERLRAKVHANKHPNFSTPPSKYIDILPIEKPAYKRSTKPLTRLAVTDILSPKESKNYGNLTISDEDIDKLFNSSCDQFEEIKGPINTITNVQAQDSNKYEELCSNKEKCPLPAAPTSATQFYSNWKELTTKQKYNYLKSIPLKQLCKILGAGFDSDTLSDIINILHDFYLPEKDATTANTLLEVSKNREVSILSLLMSKKERKVLAKIINSLKEENALDTAMAEQITKNFKLTA